MFLVQQLVPDVDPQLGDPCRHPQLAPVLAFPPEHQLWPAGWWIHGGILYHMRRLLRVSIDDRSRNRIGDALAARDAVTSLVGLPTRSAPYFNSRSSRIWPIWVSCRCSAIRSSISRRRLVKIFSRASNSQNALLNARAFSSSVPSTAAGSWMPQWAVIGCPGQTGHTSWAALSQTVNTKSSGG